MKKRILVAPLNWGFGHATRCIPIVNALIACDFEPIIASDGAALTLLQKEFPELTCVELPSYNITYSKNGKHFKIKMIKDSPKLIKAIKSEKRATKLIVNKYGIDGIISDNRLGVYKKNIPNVFITHQLNVLSGMTTWFSSKMHQRIIRKYDVCWIPDTDMKHNLSGKLGHVNTLKLPIKYIGPLSRFEKKSNIIVNDYLVLLSGPEPQRTLLEEILLKEMKKVKGKVVVVRGVMGKEHKEERDANMIIHNFMTSKVLEETINTSKVVISRSGYTTIMDLAKLNKEAFFIPTPGQFEQMYLAKRLRKEKIVPSCYQHEFTIDKLKEVSAYKGLKSIDFHTDFKALFSLFESE